MNPQEHPFFRALSVRLQGPGADDVIQLLINDEKLHARLCASDFEAWPHLANAVAKVSAIRAQKAIDEVLNTHGMQVSEVNTQSETP